MTGYVLDASISMAQIESSTVSCMRERFARACDELCRASKSGMISLSHDDAGRQGRHDQPLGTRCEALSALPLANSDRHSHDH